MKIVVTNPQDKNFEKKYLTNRYHSLFNILDDNNIDKICNKIWHKSRWIIICKMKDNSYCLCEDFLKNNRTEITFIFKNRRKRWMIKNGYIKRNSELKREDRDINNRFRKSTWNK